MPRPIRDPAVAERFGRNLRRVRRREGLSQETLAERAGLHRTSIGLLERGERVCGIDTLVRLAGSMSVPSEELLDGINWVPAVGPDPVGSFVVDAGELIGEKRTPVVTHCVPNASVHSR
jgi:transcriptional regulator with XRE-family HTH domain